MKANKMMLFSDVLEKNKRVFKVPVYQRNYDWSNIQCEKLFQDILEAKRKDSYHFTGTIVYIEDVNGGSGLNEVLIIDGQQRITTVYILLKSLYDAAKGGKSYAVENEIHEVMFNRNCDELYKVKLKPVKSDKEQLMLLIKDEVEKMDRNCNVYKNYITFNKMIESALQAKLELNDILGGIKKLEVVEIILDKSQGDEPQKIFESINSTGLELSLADLIRNYLMMDDDQQDDLYDNYWIEIEKNVGYRNLGDFFINFLNSQIAKSVNNKNAYSLFKEYCEINNLSHENILKNLKRTSKYYGAFIGENKFYSDEIEKYLNAFNTIKQTTILPLLFRIFNDYEDKKVDENTLCKVLQYLLTYLVRITACEINKNLNKFMKSMYDRVIDGNYNDYYEKFVIFLNDLRANDRMPTDKEFKDALKFKPLYKKPICKFLLSIIENSTKEHLDVSNLTIEHILPQKENAVIWKKELGDDYSKVYEVFLHTLGNLTITGLNSELGTKAFSKKKEIIKENSKANILNADVLNAKKWNEKSILRRADKLSDIIITEFEYVNKHSAANYVTGLNYNANSKKDFSNTTPDGFAFEGEHIKVSSWSDMLAKFITLAFDLNPEVITDLARKNYSLPNATGIYITNDKRKLRRAKEVDNSGIYYEVNLSSNTIVSFIKNILLIMNLETDDFSFSLAKVQFNINDERAWKTKSIPVGKLFYYLFENLLKNEKITEKEIIKLKTKEYTKSLFSATNYPAIADKWTDNMGKSSQKRYRKEPLSVNGVDIYITTEFFDSDREAIIGWYKKHMK